MTACWQLCDFLTAATAENVDQLLYPSQKLLQWLYDLFWQSVPSTTRTTTTTTRTRTTFQFLQRDDRGKNLQVKIGQSSDLPSAFAIVAAVFTRDGKWDRLGTNQARTIAESEGSFRLEARYWNTEPSLQWEKVKFPADI